jgi:hypothetical protein
METKPRVRKIILSTLMRKPSRECGISNANLE